MCWWMPGYAAFLAFFTPGFMTDMLYTPDTSEPPCPAPPVARYSDTSVYIAVYDTAIQPIHYTSRYTPPLVVALRLRSTLVSGTQFASMPRIVLVVRARPSLRRNEGLPCGSAGAYAAVRSSSVPSTLIVAVIMRPRLRGLLVAVILMHASVIAPRYPVWPRPDGSGGPGLRLRRKLRSREVGNVDPPQEGAFH